jgi:hypothetical protein
VDKDGDNASWPVMPSCTSSNPPAPSTTTAASMRWRDANTIATQDAASKASIPARIHLANGS